MRTFAICCTALLAAGLLALNCAKEEPTITVGGGGGAAAVSGQVTDRGGAPLGGVAVSSGAASTTTGADGSFTLEGVAAPGTRAVLRFTKTDFFDAIVGLSPTSSTTANVRVMLNPKQSIGSGNAGTAISVSGGGVVFAADPGVFVTPSGQSVTGTVTVRAAAIDPADSNFGIAAPGGDFLGEDPAGGDGVVGSNGMGLVEVDDASGQAVKLKSGATVTIGIPAGGGPLAKAAAVLPDSVGLWLIRPDGVWVKKGVARLVGGGARYEFKTAELGVLNCGLIRKYARLSGKICGPNGAPAPAEKIQVGLLIVYSQADGFFGARVPAGVELLVRSRFGSSVVPPLQSGALYSLNLGFCDSSVIAITFPPDGASLTTNQITVRGIVSVAAITTGNLILNGGSPLQFPVSLGQFAVPVGLQPGANTIRVEVTKPTGGLAWDQVSVDYTAAAAESAYVRWNANLAPFSVTRHDTVLPFAGYDTTLSELLLLAQDRQAMVLFLHGVKGQGTYGLTDFYADTTSWGLYDRDSLLGTPNSEFLTTATLTGTATITTFAPTYVAGTFSFTGGLRDSVQVGAGVVPSVRIAGGVFRVPLLRYGGAALRPLPPAASRAARARDALRRQR